MITDSFKCGSLANLMGEGDDGLQVFADAFVTFMGDKYSFGTEWCKGYAEYGFKIEPQGPTGDLEYHECVTSRSERLEFCSEIAVSVGNETYYFPKPGKLSNSLTVSFDLGNPRSRAGLTKATAMMANCIHQPLLFALCKAMVDGHRADGGNLDLKHLRRLMGRDEEIDEEGFEERLEKEHMRFMSDPVAPKRMMQALERETGISVADQELAILGLSTGNRETVTACLRALRA